MAREQPLDSHPKEPEKAPGSKIGTKEDPEEAGRAAGQAPVGLFQEQSLPLWGPGPCWAPIPQDCTEEDWLSWAYL